MRRSVTPAAVFLAVLLTLPVHALHLAAATAATISLYWTAPGDDSTVGSATSYDLRYSTVPITESNFQQAIRVTTMPPPAPAGTSQSVSVTGLMVNTTYYFAMKSVDERGNWSKISNVAAKTVTGAVGIGDGITLRFTTPWPNPCRDRASFSIGVPQAAEVSIEAYDVSGRHVRTLAKGSREAGEGTLVWDLRDDEGRALGTGLYLVRARIGDQSFVRRVIVQH